ncbi:MAG: ParA family protein [Bdellovibrio sp. CG10_big_fil_rev_8_21_14_0_10_47_8]|nr:MAG: ParA family protein [Bdellovibrio sp. CG10_big_fil_rev_8_21_14_0_10_47_8]
MAEATSNDFVLSTSDLAQLVGKDPRQVIREIESLNGPLKAKSHILPQVVRRYLSSLGFQYPHQVISFQMLKGGVAKTTSTLNFGLRAAMYGCKVLFIDLDQQANLTYALGAEAEERPVWIDIVEKKASIEQTLIPIDEGIDLVPSSLNNSVLDRALLNSNRNWAQAVKAPLKEIRSFYDLVIIDTAPNLSAINTAVTCASDQIILPINPDKFSILGLEKHLQDLRELKSEFDLNFQEHVLFTRFDGRESASREILSQCIEKFEDLLLKSYIRTSADIKNTIGSSRTIFSSKSNAKADYDLVTRELLGMEKLSEPGSEKL